MLRPSCFSRLGQKRSNRESILERKWKARSIVVVPFPIAVFARADIDQSCSISKQIRAACEIALRRIVMSRAGVLEISVRTYKYTLSWKVNETAADGTLRA